MNVIRLKPLFITQSAKLVSIYSAKLFKRTSSVVTTIHFSQRIADLLNLLQIPRQTILNVDIHLPVSGLKYHNLDDLADR